MDRAALDAPHPAIESNDVIVTAFKPADDGQGFILRLFAAAGKDANVTLTWRGHAPQAVYLSDTLESRGRKVDGAIKMPGWSLVTLRVE
jgi:alpha-mannosidase